MKNYQLLLDQWEGSLDIDEGVLLDAGIAGVITRINSIGGGHHLDDNFQRNWLQTKIFPVRAVYFVYNPWVSGKANFEYLKSIMPLDAKVLMPDIEVIYTGYSQEHYAQQYAEFIYLALQVWEIQFSYTGGWFYEHIAWLPEMDYCLARYPFSLYPAGAQVWTWQKVRAIIEQDDFIWNPGTPPKLRDGTILSKDRVRFWQCSGDRLILPGTKGKAIDVIIWNGDLKSLTDYFGAAEQPPPAEDLAEVWKTLQDLQTENEAQQIDIDKLKTWARGFDND